MTFIKKSFLFFTFIGLSLVTNLHAQSFDRFNPPVKVDGNILKNPWAGGLNAPQFSEGDFNNDGIEDLFVFDRAGDVPMVFLNGGTPGEIDYTFAPEYLEGLPKLNSWVLLRDFDGDGIQDIFCYPNLFPVSGIEVYKGSYENNKLQFELFKFPNYAKDIIPYTTFSGSLLNLAVTSIDIPAIDDIDGDGDLDIVTFNLNGGKLELFENQSFERGYGRDSLIFRIVDNCWGGVYESGVTPELDLATSKGECAKRLMGNVVRNRHAGSTVLTLDMDNDGDKEVALGDVSFDHILMAFNGGDPDEAWMNKQDTFFPSDGTPIDIPAFPATFYLDVDNDGLKDLIAARNEKNVGESKDVAWFYKNIGSNEFPEFQLRQKDFLVGEMLDFGTGAFPVFEDIDRDGKVDLIVGNEAFYSRTLGGNSESKLFLFKNTGTTASPEFELVDENWLDFRKYSKIGGGSDWAFNPSFGDLNHDGHADLLVGSLDGGFYYAENDGNGNFLRAIQKFQDLDVGRFSAPLVADFDGDQLNDILLSESNAAINFMKNIGTADDPVFEEDENSPPNSTFFGGIDLRENGNVNGFGAMSIINADGGVQLIVGNDNGSIRMYEVGNMPSDNFELLDANLGNTFNGIRVDPSFADLDNDLVLEMVVGNYRGGLTFYKTNLNLPVSTKEPKGPLDMSASPNPSQGNFSVTVFEKGEINLTDALGKIVLTEKVNTGESFFNIQNQPAGMYILIFENEKGQKAIEKLIVK